MHKNGMKYGQMDEKDIEQKIASNAQDSLFQIREAAAIIKPLKRCGAPKKTEGTSMTSRERVVAAINHQQPDRIPLQRVLRRAVGNRFLQKSNRN